MKKILVIGYGNPGRLDDGLGPALAEELSGMDLPGVTVDSNYQLTVEDAAAVAAHDQVLFADAHVSCEPPFCLHPITPRPALSFSSHSVEPAAVLALAEELFQAKTQGFALGIRGVEFNEFGERLSEPARQHLREALDYIVPFLKRGTLDGIELQPDPNETRHEENVQ